MTIQIKEGAFRVFTGDKAQEIYTEYEKKYGFANPERYSVYWNCYTKEPLITEDMLRECFEECGVDAEEAIRFLVEEEKLELEYMQESIFAKNV